MAINKLHWDDFVQALYEGLDGIDYKTAKKIHKALYPEAKVKALSGNMVEVTFPDIQRTPDDGKLSR